MRALPGHPVTYEELRAFGFAPHDLDVYRVDVALPGGAGCEWTTLGDVPDSPGLYAFTVNDNKYLSIVYVGLTRHLWMVTKGRLPRSGGARGGQHYGRPRHAGNTRKRVNILIASEIAEGNRIQQWLRPTEEPQLASEEETFIRRWRLRELGWNVA